MIYINRITLPREEVEYQVIMSEKRTCFPSFYPFKIFPDKLLREIQFEGITMFYGGNGSGKSTLLNVIAQKINAIRFSDYNDAPFFGKYVDLCSVNYYKTPPKSYVLTSDDVFDYVLSARAVNETIDDKRNRLIDKYVETKRKAVYDPEIARFSLEHFDEWKEVREILSPRRTQSKFVKNRVEKNVEMFSNGETALQYFYDRIDEDAVYLLDEPDNSLSVEFQMQLAEYITATARATRSQFIIATHSPILLSMRGASVYNLDDCPADVCNWTDLPNVRRYFAFFMEHKDEFQ